MYTLQVYCYCVPRQYKYKALKGTILWGISSAYVSRCMGALDRIEMTHKIDVKQVGIRVY